MIQSLLCIDNSYNFDIDIDDEQKYDRDDNDSHNDNLLAIVSKLSLSHCEAILTYCDNWSIDRIYLLTRLINAYVEECNTSIDAPIRREATIKTLIKHKSAIPPRSKVAQLTTFQTAIKPLLRRLILQEWDIGANIKDKLSELVSYGEEIDTRFKFCFAIDEMSNILKNQLTLYMNGNQRNNDGKRKIESLIRFILKQDYRYREDIFYLNNITFNVVHNSDPRICELISIDDEMTTSTASRHKESKFALLLTTLNNGNNVRIIDSFDLFNKVIVELLTQNKNPSQLTFMRQHKSKTTEENVLNRCFAHLDSLMDTSDTNKRKQIFNWKYSNIMTVTLNQPLFKNDVDDEVSCICVTAIFTYIFVTTCFIIF